MTYCPSVPIVLPTHAGISPQSEIPQAGADRSPQTMPALRELCLANKWTLATTYALFNIENCAQLAHPWLLGLTIGGILDGRWSVLWMFAGFFTLRMTIGVVRRMYDTRAFTRIYQNLATDLVVNQRRKRIDVARVAARASLSREIPDFLERDVPAGIATTYSVLGGLVMLGCFDPLLAFAALLAGCGGVALNTAFAKHARMLNKQVNDLIEDEVRVVACGSPASTRQHYSGLSDRRIRASDWHAVTFSATQVFVLALLVVALFRIPVWGTESIGDVYAVLRYVTMFNMGISGLPFIAQRLARVSDIRRRFETVDDDGPPSGGRSIAH